MRLPVISPATLNQDQKALYDDMRKGIASNFHGFINVRGDGALLDRGIPGCTSRNSANPYGS
jgi:4-carboxymuconolactone decarboxylase